MRSFVSLFACERFGPDAGDDKRIDIVVLAEVNKRLLVVFNGLRIQAVYRSVERSKNLTGREIRSLTL